MGHIVALRGECRMEICPLLHGAWKLSFWCFMKVLYEGKILVLSPATLSLHLGERLAIVANILGQDYVSFRNVGIPIRLQIAQSTAYKGMSRALKINLTSRSFCRIPSANPLILSHVRSY